MDLEATFSLVSYESKSFVIGSDGTNLFRPLQFSATQLEQVSSPQNPSPK
jgi:hypothetical protein